MKKILALILAVLMCVAMLAGCNKGETPNGTENGGATTPNGTENGGAATPEVPGTVYDSGEFKALVPEGWAAFPITDAFSETSEIDTSCFNIIKDGKSDLDLFSNPYVRLDYYGPDTEMMKPSSEYYENVQEIAPTQFGSHSWTGFIGEDGYGKSAILWCEEGNIQYQAIIWLEIEGKTISIEDADVQAILASVVPSDGSVGNGGAEGGGESTPAASYDWWETEWYGWWCIKNATGTYKSADGIAWDAFAEIEVNNDNTGRVHIWDTGTSKDQPLIIGYDVTYEPGAGEHGKLVSKRVQFFPYGVWNNGAAAVTADERTVGWTIDPADSTVKQFQDMVEITGHYASPDNAEDAFDYYIFLRPWGTLWEDVRTGDTTGCLYKDMMPLYHDNWYVSLLNLGFEHPTGTFQEGIDIINKYLEEQGNGGSGGGLDPNAKEGADGAVSMETLKELLPWCKKECSYSTTYMEIANKFGAHGKQIESLFEGKTIYRWIASENDHIQITFDLHEDGSETWNVTQWKGIE